MMSGVVLRENSLRLVFAVVFFVGVGAALRCPSAVCRGIGPDQPSRGSALDAARRSSHCCMCYRLLVTKSETADRNFHGLVWGRNWNAIGYGV